MKFSSYNQTQNQNHNDTLIGRLKEFDDGYGEQRSFGVEIQNRPYVLYSINKKKPYSIEDFGTSEQLFQSQLKIETGDIPQIEKDYRMSILINMLNSDSPIKYNQNNHEERNLIVNWLVLIHLRYQFESQTLHEGVRIFDRFITTRDVDVQQYEKYALTAFWMAAKIEQRKVKQIRLLITFGKGYSINEVLLAQKQIMQSLNHVLISNTSQRFLCNFASFFVLKPKAFTLCNYLVQLTLLDITYLKYHSSIIGLSCLLVCSKILRREMPQKMTAEIQNIALLLNMKAKILYECAKKICRMLQSASENKLNSVYRKYSSKKHFKISLIRLGKILK